jgi:hypothetical protein
MRVFSADLFRPLVGPVRINSAPPLMPWWWTYRERPTLVGVPEVSSAPEALEALGPLPQDWQRRTTETADLVAADFAGGALAPQADPDETVPSDIPSYRVCRTAQGSRGSPNFAERKERAGANVLPPIYLLTPRPVTKNGSAAAKECSIPKTFAQTARRARKERAPAFGHFWHLQDRPPRVTTLCRP